MTSQSLLCHQPSKFPSTSLQLSASSPFSLTRQAEGKSSFESKSYLVRLLLSGEEQFRVDHQTYSLEEGQYLIINPKQTVQYHVSTQSTGLWVMLPQQDVERHLRKEEQRQDASLNSLFNANTYLMCEHIYEAQRDPLGRWLTEWVAQNQGTTSESLPWQEAYQHTLQLLIESQLAVFKCMERLNSAKRSTKLELYKRLCIAKSYIHHNLDQNLDLDTLARVACLSKYHFIRLFKEAYGETPRQYLIAQRLERARELLIHTRLTFHEICHEVGLKDSSSFGRLFKRNFGATPQVYRNQYIAQAAA